jgi:hypothetical protein
MKSSLGTIRYEAIDQRECLAYKSPSLKIAPRVGTRLYDHERDFNRVHETGEQDRERMRERCCSLIDHRRFDHDRRPFDNDRHNQMAQECQSLRTELSRFVTIPSVSTESSAASAHTYLLSTSRSSAAPPSSRVTSPTSSPSYITSLAALPSGPYSFSICSAYTAYTLCVCSSHLSVVPGIYRSRPNVDA